MGLLHHAGEEWSIAINFMDFDIRCFMDFYFRFLWILISVVLCNRA
jgi:hypothetical protein